MKLMIDLGEEEHELSLAGRKSITLTSEVVALPFRIQHICKRLITTICITGTLG